MIETKRNIQRWNKSIRLNRNFLIIHFNLYSAAIKELLPSVVINNDS